MVNNYMCKYAVSPLTGLMFKPICEKVCERVSVAPLIVDYKYHLMTSLHSLLGRINPAVLCFRQQEQKL